MVVGAFEGIDVEAADREEHLVWLIESRVDGGVPCACSLVGEFGHVVPSFCVPVVNECHFEFPNGWPLDAHVGVSPFCFVERTYVVAANEPDFAVSDEDLSVVASGFSRVEG